MIDPATPLPIDGVDTLRKRDQTRLWYRQTPAPAPTLSPLEALALSKPASAVQVLKSESPSPRLTDQLIQERVQSLRGLDEIRTILENSADGPMSANGIHPTARALTDWRDASLHSPVILLSASHILDARNPGPILGPGTRYRILSIDNGVVALQVATLDGQIATGYCNAVDIICFEPDIAYHRRDRQTGKLGTARLGLNRITQRISGVTTSHAG